MADHLAAIIATAFYSGTIPFLPGVWGAGLGLLLWRFCRELPLPIYVAMAVGLLVTGVWAAGEAERIFGRSDAKPIVIDETLGAFIALAGASRTRFRWLWGVLIFLVLDVTKPFPASWLDANLSGGFGIIMDDIAVAFYTLGLLLLISRLAPEPQKGGAEMMEPTKNRGGRGSLQ